MSPAGTIPAFCQQYGLIVGDLISEDIRDNNPSIEFVENLVALAASGVSGAKDLAAEIVTLDRSAPHSESRYPNLLTECLALRFAQQALGVTICAVESKQSPIRAPRAWNKAKSCDFTATIKGQDVYFEVKDFTADLLAAQRTTITNPFYTPARDAEKREWLETKIRDALAKGANYLIARMSTWQRVGSADPIENALKEIVRPYTDISPNEVRISLSKPAPSWFQGAFLIRRTGHLLVRVA
jgi:hypothetical protein